MIHKNPRSGVVECVGQLAVPCYDTEWPSAVCRGASDHLAACVYGSKEILAVVFTLYPWKSIKQRCDGQPKKRVLFPLDRLADLTATTRSVHRASVAPQGRRAPVDTPATVSYAPESRDRTWRNGSLSTAFSDINLTCTLTAPKHWPPLYWLKARHILDLSNLKSRYIYI